MKEQVTVFKWKKHVDVVCNLYIGQNVTVKGWGHKLNDIPAVIEDIKLSVGCESAVLVKISIYDSYLDSNWITVI